MIFSIYHFFAHLVERRQCFLTVAKLDQFPFDQSLLSCQCKGVFPDMAIRLGGKDGPFRGGELIELKDCRTAYLVSSFNSTIPRGRKNIADFIFGEKTTVRTQMEQAGEDPNSLPVRDVFYLVRGKKRNSEDIKVCLVHGSFFETVTAIDLIRDSFSQAIEQAAVGENLAISNEEKEKFLDILSKQKYFSKTRKVEKSSVSLRFRIMTEAEAEGNILNGKKYPEIKDNSLNLAVPFKGEDSFNAVMKAFRQSPLANVQRLRVIRLQHHFNGPFVVFQILIKDSNAE